VYGNHTGGAYFRARWKSAVRGTEMIENPELLRFIDIIYELKSCGGNYLIEWDLFQRIQSAGVQVNELTIGEFLAMNRQSVKLINEAQNEEKRARI
jgi:hypothetical protein